MKKLLITLICMITYSVSNATLPTIMVIPFTKNGEDIRTVMDNDINTRVAITKVKEGFDNKGFTTVDFIGKLKAAKDNHVFTSDNQLDIKSGIIEMSGCDVYVMVEVDTRGDTSGSSVNVVLSAYETSTGNSLANKVGSSGIFYSTDYAKLTARAINNCIDDFVDVMDRRFLEIESQGYSLFVDFSFAENASTTMKTAIPQFNKYSLSDVLEDWFSKNTLNGSYHIQGTTSLKMIFDNVKVPLKDRDGRNYNANRFALEISKFLTSIGLSNSKEIKSNTIYITIN